MTSVSSHRLISVRGTRKGPSHLNRRSHWPVVAGFVVLSIFFLSASVMAQLASQSSSALVMDLAANQERFAPVDAAIKNAILQGHTPGAVVITRSEEHTSELQSPMYLV